MNGVAARLHHVTETREGHDEIAMEEDDESR